MWLSGISGLSAGGAVSEWDSTMKSRWVRTVTSQYRSWYDHRCCQGIKQQHTNMARHKSSITQLMLSVIGAKMLIHCQLSVCMQPSTKWEYPHFEQDIISMWRLCHVTWHGSYDHIKTQKAELVYTDQPVGPALFWLILFVIYIISS